MRDSIASTAAPTALSSIVIEPATKPMPANGSGNAIPSAMLAESLALLSKSAHEALAEAENRALQNVAKANSDAGKAQLERDKALEALHAAQLEVQELQREVANVKATLKQTELSVSHHKETIAQLRREATQWKDQSRNWQEHFLRVEQERCNLTTRIEELVSERLQWSRSLPTPFTPNHPAVDTSMLAASPKPRHPSMSSRKRPISPPDVDSPSSSISGYKFNRMASKPIQVIKNKDSTPTRNLFSHDSSTSTSNQNSNLQHGRIRQSPPNPKRSPSRTTVLRRVHAVINVKQEEESDGESEHPVTESTMIATNPKRAPPRKRKAVYHDKGYASNEESDHVPSGSDQSSEYDDNEEVVDDEDDELMLGGQTNEEKRSRTSKNTPGQYLSTVPSKKRRITLEGDKPPARRKN